MHVLASVKMLKQQKISASNETTFYIIRQKRNEHGLLHIIDFYHALFILRLVLSDTAKFCVAYLAKCFWIRMDMTFSIVKTTDCVYDRVVNQSYFLVVYTGNYLGFNFNVFL